MNFEDLFDGLTAGLPDVEAETDDGGALIWSRGGRSFAALSATGATAEFGLDPAVAAAATKTPDVSDSDRAPGWVAFRPAGLDGHAVDRATAWFVSAHRRLAPR